MTGVVGRTGTHVLETVCSVPLDDISASACVSFSVAFKLPFILQLFYDVISVVYICDSGYVMK